MSSTARGGQREISDYYVTPVAEVTRFLKAWAQDEKLDGIKRIFDPCAGGTLVDGKITVPMSYPAAISTAHFPAMERVETMDIRGDSPAEIIRDYLFSQPAEMPDLIITNPPFSIAVEITEKALREVAEGGFVVMLQRLNWYGSEKRQAFWRAQMPKFCYIHSERMGFRKHLTELPIKERNATESIEYAHFVWQKGVFPRFTQTRVI